jgi:hypothetical protein
VDVAAVKGLGWFVVALFGVAVSMAGLLLGAWWLTFFAGLLVGALVRRGRVAIPVGALAGLLGWGFGLATLELHFGLGPTAASIAAIMGFTHQPAVPVILTCLVGLLLGLTGAWLASAARSIAAPATN